MSTLLGLPGFGPPPGAASAAPVRGAEGGPYSPTWHDAWDTALYGPAGFFRRTTPAEHFRTAVHTRHPVLAMALLELTRRTGIDTVVDLGCGQGELLTELHHLEPGLRLVGVEIGPRPPQLPSGIRWSTGLPVRFDGLLVAHEWLDNVPAHVVETDAGGVPRVLHVDPETGLEEHGAAMSDPGVPAAWASWLTRWWPLTGLPGQRAELGLTRDRAWAQMASRVGTGLSIAVDYGHVAVRRPAGGAMRSFKEGRQVPVRVDGSRDVTADVAVDAVAAAVGGLLLSQADALMRLGVDPLLPSPDTVDEAAAYLTALTRAAEAAELAAPEVFGGYSWVVSGAGGVTWPSATGPTGAGLPSG